MEIQQNYLDLIAKYPNEINKAVAIFRKGRSKNKNIDLDKLTWCFGWCVLISSIDIFDPNAFIKANEEDNKSIEEKLKKYSSNCSVNIIAKLNGRTLIQTDKLNEVPEEILDNYRKVLVDEEKEKQRINSLSEEERQKEISDILSSLSKGKGFFKVGF